MYIRSEFKTLFIIICSTLVPFLFSPSTNNSVQAQGELNAHIVLSFPSPGPSPQGLAWDGTHLWLADDSTDTIYRMDHLNGSIVFSFTSPSPNPRGLTWDGTHLWSTDNDSFRIIELNSETGEITASIDAHFIPYNPEAFYPIDGLTWDGEFLYACFEAGLSSQIVRIDVNYDSVKYFSFTAGFPRGLAFDSISIWCCEDSWGHSLGFVYQYDINGWRLNRFITPGYNPTGITYDGEYFWLSDSNTDSLYQIQVSTTRVGVSEENIHQNSPYNFVLHQNYPNPLNPVTSIQYSVASGQSPPHVTVKIYNIIGQEIRTLVDEFKEAGYYTITWDGKDSQGQNVSSGVYFYRLQAGDFVETKKMVLMR